MPVPRNPERDAVSVLRNPESIVPCFKMQEKKCLNTPAGLNAQTNYEVGSAFPKTQLKTDTPIGKSTRIILCIRKGSIKHHEPLFYFLARIQHIFCATSVIYREKEKEKSWLTHMPVFFFRAKLMFLHTACFNTGRHLHSKYLIRKWRMAHLFGCHQWGFFNIQVKWRWISKRWRRVMVFAILWCKRIS